MPDGSVLKSVFKETERHILLGYHTWYTNTHKVAKLYGLDSGDTTYLPKPDIKDTFENHYIESWKEKLWDIENFPILRSYRLFKIGFEFESYLSLVTIRRQAITWTNVGLLSNGLLGTNISEIWIRIFSFPLKKCIWKCRLPERRPFCAGWDELTSPSRQPPVKVAVGGHSTYRHPV